MGCSEPNIEYISDLVITDRHLLMVEPFGILLFSIFERTVRFSIDGESSVILGTN